MMLPRPDFTKRFSSLAFNHTPSTRISLCICLVVGIGTWRHYDTQVHPSPFQQEVWIEWLSWVVLYIALKIIQTPSSSGLRVQQDRSFWSSSYAPWFGAFFAVGSQLLSSQQNITWVLPLITIFVSLFGKGSSAAEEADSVYQEDLASIYACFRPSKDTIRTLFIPLGLNSICFVIFAMYQSTRTSSTAWQSILGNSFLFFITRSGTISVISRLRRPAELVDEEGFEEEEKEEILSDNNVSDWLSKLATPMLAILTLTLVLVRPRLEMSNIGLIAHALAQAIWWCAFIVLIRSQLTNTAANLDTISLSAQISLTDVSVKYIGMALAAGYLAIAQSAVVLRFETFSRRVIYVVCTVFLLAIWIRHDPRLVPSTYTAKQIFDIHPIEDLIIRNRASFDAMQARQSKTVKEATTEYWRRYGRAPPQGFDKWFDLAKANNFVLIDEFDTIMQSLEPFYGVDPSVLRQRMVAALKVEGGRMNTIYFENHNATIDPNMGDIGNALLNLTWANIVPYNMTIALNGWDEPMVSAPWIDVNKAIKEAKNPNQKFRKIEQARVNPFIETGKQNGWAATSHACSIYSPSRQVECPERKLTTPLSYSNNITELRDVCLNCEILQEHGLVLSPGNMKVSHDLLPIWSHSKPSHFNDITYPAAYYIGVQGDYRPQKDSHWADKDNKFYWVGSSTGGWATEQTWDKMQRQRLVLKTKKDNVEPVQFLEETEPGSNKWHPRYSTMAEVADLFVTRISNVVQCTDAACEIQEEAFDHPKTHSGDSQDAAYSHRFVMDIDGNGFSGRYYRLLKSRSVVVKQTILKEWHDDRLIPWVHFIPLSTGYAELPEMARFLATTENGLMLSERIARESTEWHDKTLRKVDLQLVFLRMVLEYGRMMSRDVISY